ncbi:mitotic fidelity of chromosome transmission-related protein [Sporothrix epigloea]|uniref:Mitotic fidelity of chromosome transmission-related protein n=1 Tax=Sporothrix epigloea TaxID=1892477 RepID=A0ABP0DBL1_9PEZI
MASSRAGAGRRPTQTSEHIYNLGERGRKTGVMLRDTGLRDEHGMELIDDIFSSPGNSSSNEDAEEVESVAAEEDNGSDDDSDDVPMDLTTGSGLDPAAFVNGHRSAVLSGARQKDALAPSPARTLFGSPAVRGAATGKTATMRQNLLLRPPSSPSPAAIHQTSSPSKPPKRRLEYSKSIVPNTQRRPYTLAPPDGTNGEYSHSHVPDEMDNEEEPVEEVEEEPEEELDEEPMEEPIEEEDIRDYNGNYSMQMAGANDEEEEQDEEEPQLPVQPKRRAKNSQAKGKSAATKPQPPRQQVSSSAAKLKRRRPAHGSDADVIEDTEEPQAAKRRRPLPAEDEPRAKNQPKTKSTKSRAAAQRESLEKDAEDPAPSKNSRKRKSSGVGAATAAVAAVPRGPPLPKSRGLVVRRREIEDSGGHGLVKTRSGRSSFRPLAFWRNEHVEFDSTDVQLDSLDRRQAGREKFVLPSIREIVRVEDEDFRPPAHAPRRPPAASRAGRRGGRGRRADDDYDDDEPERDAWESNPGKITGDIVVWYPEFDDEPPALGQEVEMTSAEIALSDAAIQTHEVRGSTFRFVKTLSLPFFGTGMVDMPPGSEKKLKNSRKMHMTFFVHTGQVLVRVNESEFRIAKGGMWSVPRWNYYSILNDNDRPARVFFAQGCEMLPPVESEQSSGGEEGEGGEEEGEDEEEEEDED